MSLLKLFLLYAKIGAILLGGGYVILPVMISEFADKRNLVTKEELMDYFALSQSLPGIIAANMSMFIGYKLRGKTGAFVAIIGVIFVPFWLIILLGTFLNSMVNNHLIQGILWGIGLAVIALIMLTVREIWVNSKRDLFFYVIFLTSLTALLIFKLSPITTILIFTTTGVLLKKILRRNN